MTESEKYRVALAFNACINNQDIEGLADLMNDGHRFHDSAGSVVAGKAAVISAWSGFFAAFPDYRNEFERYIVTDNIVAIVGQSFCADARLSGPALWAAVIDGSKVAAWRVYEDTEDNRAQLGFVS